MQARLPDPRIASALASFSIIPIIPLMLHNQSSVFKETDLRIKQKEVRTSECNRRENRGLEIADFS
jgi:hypothetical protein